MTVTIRLSDEQATALEVKAAAEGLSLEQWIQRLGEADNKTLRGDQTGIALIAALQASPYRDMTLSLSATNILYGISHCFDAVAAGHQHLVRNPAIQG